MDGPEDSSANRRFAVAIFIGFCSMFALFGSREPPIGDAKVMYLTSESVAERGELSIDWLWPPMSQRGTQGRIYGQFAPLPSLIFVPGIWARNGLEDGTPGRALHIITSHLHVHLSAGLLAAIFFLTLLEFGLARRRAFMWTCVLMFATTCAVYVRIVYSESWQALFALMMFREARRVLAHPTRGRAAWLGIAGGLLALTKLIYLLSIAPVMALVWWRSDAHTRRRILPITIAVLGLAGALYAAYNYVRFGTPFNTGYSDTISQAQNLPLIGLYGILFSAGKSIFLMSPPLLLSVFAWRRFAPKHRDAALLIAAIVAGPTMLSCSMLSWSGDYAWGARYMVFATPLLLIPCTTVEVSRRFTQITVGLGIAIQLLGTFFYFGQFMWMTHLFRQDWLGVPNRSGSPFLTLRDDNRAHCGACYEDMHANRFLPEFSQVYGHWWLFKSKLLGRTWEEASATAPWSSNTKLKTTAAQGMYDGAVHWDWWLLEKPRHAVASLALIILTLLGLVWSARALRRM